MAVYKGQITTPTGLMGKIAHSTVVMARWQHIRGPAAKSALPLTVGMGQNDSLLVPRPIRAVFTPRLRPWHIEHSISALRRGIKANGPTGTRASTMGPGKSGHGDPGPLRYPP